MARFEFRLDRVAAFRRTAADLERARLEQLEAGLAGLRQARQSLADERDRSASALTSAGRRSESWSAQAVDIFTQYANERSRDLAAEEDRQRARIQQQRQRVMEAERACELLAKLRQRKLDAWQQNEDKQLEDLAADVYLAAWNQRRR